MTEVHRTHLGQLESLKLAGTVSSVAPVTVLTPLFGVLYSVLLLGDVLDWQMIVGGLLTLSGVTVIVARERESAATDT